MGSCPDSTVANPVAQSATTANTPGRRDNAGRELRSGGHPPAHTSAGAATVDHDGAAPALASPADWPFRGRPTSPEEFAARFPALAGCPDLDNHAQLVEAIGYRARNVLRARRKRWTRVQRQQIELQVSYLRIDAWQSIDTARAIWAELQAGRVPEQQAVPA